MDNMRFAFELFEHMETRYPNLMRPIYTTNFRYNQHVSGGALLLEIGTDGNTFEEAALTARITAGALVDLLAVS